MMFVANCWPPYIPGKNSSYHRTLVVAYRVMVVATTWTLEDGMEYCAIILLLTQSQP